MPVALPRISMLTHAVVDADLARNDPQDCRNGGDGGSVEGRGSLSRSAAYLCELGPDSAGGD
jgi:hypothetical protein